MLRKLRLKESCKKLMEFSSRSRNKLLILEILAFDLPSASTFEVWLHINIMLVLNVKKLRLKTLINRYEFYLK